MGRQQYNIDTAINSIQPRPHAHLLLPPDFNGEEMAAPVAAAPAPALSPLGPEQRGAAPESPHHIGPRPEGRVAGAAAAAVAPVMLARAGRGGALCTAPSGCLALGRIARMAPALLPVQACLPLLLLPAGAAAEIQELFSGTAQVSASRILGLEQKF